MRRAALVLALAACSPLLHAQAPSPAPTPTQGAAPATTVWSASPDSPSSVLKPESFPFEKRAPTPQEDAQFKAWVGQWQEDQKKKDFAGMRQRSAAILGLLDATLGPEHPVRAKSAANLARGFYFSRQLDDAAALLGPALTTLETRLSPFHADTIQAAITYTGVLVEKDVPIPQWGEHPSLYFIRTRVMGAFETTQTLADADWIEAAAQVAQSEERLESVVDLRRRVLAIRVKQLPPGHLDIGSAQNRLASSLADLGVVDEAEALANQALQVFNAQPEPVPAIATVHGTLAKVRLLRGHPDQAEPLFRRALETRLKLNGPADPTTLQAEAELARFLAAQGREVEAMPMFESLYERRKAAGMLGFRTIYAMLDAMAGLRDAATCRRVTPSFVELSESPGFLYMPIKARMRIHEGIGNLHACAGRFADAAAAFEAANQDFMGAQFVLDNAEFGLANARYALRLAGEPSVLDKASGFAGQAVGIANSRRRRGFANSDAPKFDSALSRALHSAGGGTPLAAAYDAQLAVSWLAHQQGQSWGIAQAWLAAQSLDVSGAAQAMAQTSARIAAGSGPLADLARRQQDLAAQAVEADRDRAQAVAQADRSREEAANDKLQALGRQLDEVQAALSKDFPQYAELVSPSPVPLMELQSRLGDDEGVLLVVPSRGDLHVFAVSKTAAEWQRIAGGADAIGKRVARLRCEVDPATCGGDGTADGRGVQSVYGTAVAQGGKTFDRDVANALYREVFAPVEPAFAQVKRVFVTTTGALGQLPLGMLLTAAPVAGESDADPDVLARSAWLADRYALITLPAVSALRQGGERATAGGGRFLGFGAPQLAGATAVARGAAGARLFVRTDGQGPALADVERVRRLAPLPGTRVELQAMAGLFGADARLLLGTQATEATLKASPDLAQASVLAFATHGLLPRELQGMDEPGLVFTPPASPSTLDDGVLTASEAAKLSLAAEWIILSACNTAAGEGQGGDSLSGLAKSFLYAGAQSLLASHWRVSDDATAALTTETLAVRLATPALSRAQALQQAMRAVRTGKRADGSALPGWKPAWSHPAAWAPFVLVSDRDR